MARERRGRPLSDETVLPFCSQKRGALPRVCTSASSPPAPPSRRSSTSCSVSTKLAAAPSSLTPRALTRVPACSHERRESRQLTSCSPGGLPGSGTASHSSAPCIIGVIHGPRPATSSGASAARFHTKRWSASSQLPGSAPRARAAAARAALSVSGCPGAKKTSPASRRSLSCARCLVARPEAVSTALSSAAFSAARSAWLLSPPGSSKLLGVGLKPRGTDQLSVPGGSLSGRKAVLAMACTGIGPRSHTAWRGVASVTITSDWSS